MVNMARMEVRWMMKDVRVKNHEDINRKGP
jgi:hypothetical protein